MTELSPSAQAVDDAYWKTINDKWNIYDRQRAKIAAALRATADQVVPDENPPPDFYDHAVAAEIDQRRTTRDQILAIAAELETQTESQISKEENERRFKKCLRIIQNTTHEELVELMGEDFLEEFRRASQR